MPDETEENTSRAKPRRPKAPPHPLLEEFYQQLAISNSKYTLRNYTQAIADFSIWHEERWGGPPNWLEITRDTFRAYLLSPHTSKRETSVIRLRFAALRAFYRWLINTRKLEDSPMEGIRPGKLGQPLPTIFTQQQLERLEAAPGASLQKERAKGEKAQQLENIRICRDIAVFKTLDCCGLRISEVCGLAAQDLRADHTPPVIDVKGKGRKERTIPIGEPALDAILHYWSLLPKAPTKEEPVFLVGTSLDKPLSPRTFQYRVVKWLATADVQAPLPKDPKERAAKKKEPRLSAHKMRHTFATRALDAGVGLLTIKKLLGHANLATTEKYTHLTTQKILPIYKKAHPRA
jgi:site-specific recombinase XerD